MADRTSAGLFAKIFELLAKNPTDEHRAMAREIWSFTGEYDFSPYQMSADDSLIALGLARVGVNSRYPEDGVVILYPSDDEDV